jgi:hypothetical protein
MPSLAHTHTATAAHLESVAVLLPLCLRQRCQPPLHQQLRGGCGLGRQHKAQVVRRRLLLLLLLLRLLSLLGVQAACRCCGAAAAAAAAA